MIGQREGLSEKDIKKLGKMYGCFKGDEENYTEEEESKEKPDMEEEEEHLMLLPKIKSFNIF
jgi:hypothetical protein